MRADDPISTRSVDKTSPGSAILLAAPAILLALLVLAPFYGKAFTIDDTLFLLQARQALSDPLHPAAFEVVWSEIPQRLSGIMPSGPVMAYLLMPVVALGGIEWLAHLIQGLVLGIGLVSTAALALRLGYTAGAARLAALLVAGSPAVLAMASTSMPDIPAMSFGVLGMERYVAFVTQRRWHQGLAAAVALALATLSRSQVGLLLGVAAILVMGELLWQPKKWRALPWRELWPLALCVVLVALVFRVTSDPQGTGVLSSTAFFANLAALPRNLLAFLSHWSLSMPLVLPWAILRRKELRRLVSRLHFWIVAVLLGVAMSLVGYWHMVYIAPALVLCALCLVDILRSAYVERNRETLMLGAWLLLSLPVALYIHFAAKYLVPSAPAAALLLVRLLYMKADSREPMPRRLTAQARWVMGATLSLGVVLGLLIIRADAAFAALGRRAAAELIAPRVRRGERVWFVGHWGFQWYAEHAGARSLSRTQPIPQPGDILVASRRADGHAIHFMPNRQPIESLIENRPGGRIMSEEVGAGFYSNGCGLLPWMWSRSELDRYDVFTVLSPAASICLGSR